MHPVHEMVIWGLLALLVCYLSPPEVPEHGLLPKVFGLLRRHTRVSHDWRSFTVGFAWGFVPECVLGSVLGYVLIMLCDILRKMLLGSL